jgi:hypothetical protein
MTTESNWIITEEGIDASRGAKAPDYFIHKDRLLETTERGNGKLYDWPVHLSEKAFMTKEAIREFLDVFESASKRYGYELDTDIMSNTRKYVERS